MVIMNQIELSIMNKMNLYQSFDPIRFYSEMFYSILIIIIFLFIFFKTKEIYDITKHKGIYYFRLSFLFFALAYFSRLLYHITKLLLKHIDIYIPGRTISFISIVIVTYLVTIAIGYLIYSNIWKKLSHKMFLLYINIFALIITIIFSLTLSLLFIILIQIYLIIVILIINSKKKIKFLYSLISLFWIFNLIIFYSRKLLDFEIKIMLQIISIFILSYLIYRILKWTK
jgi:hypothetical protein